MDRDEFRRLFRLPYSEFYEEHLPGIALADLEHHFRKAFAESPVAVTVLPHAREKLEWCREHGVRCFVLTSMDRDTFEGQLDDLNMRHYFEATYSGVVDKREVIGSLVENHELDVSQTAFLGDMIHDIVTAKHGGVASVALLTGYTHREVLQAQQPDWLMADLLEFREMLDQHRRSS
jgi:phosphoglycolate phosphatase